MRKLRLLLVSSILSIFGCKAPDVTFQHVAATEQQPLKTITIRDVEIALEACMMPSVRAVFESQFDTAFDGIETNEPTQKLFAGCTVDPGYPYFSWVCARYVCVTDYQNELDDCDAFSTGPFRGNAVFIGNYLSDVEYLKLYHTDSDFEFSTPQTFEAVSKDMFPKFSGTVLETPENKLKKRRQDWRVGELKLFTVDLNQSFEFENSDLGRIWINGDGRELSGCLEMALPNLTMRNYY